MTTFLTADLTISTLIEATTPFPEAAFAWGPGGPFTLTIANTGTLRVTGESAVGVDGSGGFGAFVNNGTLDVDASDFFAYGFRMSGGGSVSVINSAGALWKVYGGANGNGAVGINSSVANQLFANHGRLELESEAAGFGVGFSAGGVVTNTGTIDVLADGAAYGISIFGFGATSSINNSGAIITEGDTAAIGIEIRSGGSLTLSAPNITNSGTIMTNVVGGEDPVLGTAILATEQLSTEWVANSGTLNGDINLGLGDDRMVNTGTINLRLAAGGGLFMGAGNDHVDNTLGVIVGSFDVGGGASVGVNLGDGNDTFLGGAGDEIVLGDLGEDIIDGGGGADRLDGGLGADTLRGRAGADALDGGDGVDVADYSASNAGVTVNLGTQTGSGGDATGDTLSNIENVVGSASNDVLNGDLGANTLTGGAGDDVLAGLAGADVLSGEAGADTVNYSASTAAVSVNLAVQTASSGDATGDTLLSIENAVGSAFDDTLRGSFGNNVLSGGAGDDVLTGDQGQDVVDGGDGVDTATYENGNITLDLTVAGPQPIGDGHDTLISIENLTGSFFHETFRGDGGANVLLGGDGNDVLEGRAGPDTLAGGAGIDTVEYGSSDAGVVVDLAASDASGGDATGDSLSGVENVTGSVFNDALRGDAGANLLIGGLGDDMLAGGDGDDTLYGGDGALGDLGGNDTASYANSSGAVAVSIWEVDSTQNTGGAGVDRLVYIENLIGSAFGDTLSGSDSANVLDGGDGDDLLMGAGGADVIVGNAGMDVAAYNESFGGVTINLATHAASGGTATGDVLSGIESIRGSSGVDSLTGDAGVNHLDGYTDDDVIAGLGGADTLDGGAGRDTADYSASSVAVTINLATGAASGGDAAGDMLQSFECVIGSSFDDMLAGDGGDNTMRGGAGADVLAGGAGLDTIDYTGSSAGVIVNLAAETASGGDAEGDTLSGFEHAVGSANDDELIGDDADNVLVGGAGVDTASYAASASAVSVDLARVGPQHTGGAGVDTLTGFENLTGSDFNDTLSGDAGANVLDGGAGDDRLIGGFGADVIIGGAGVDTYVDLAGTVNLTTGTGSGGDTLSGVENVWGSGTIIGDGNANALTGYFGSDTISGLGGDDDLSGGPGTDTAIGGLGSDVYHVDEEADIVIENPGEGTDVVVAFDSYVLPANVEELRLSEFAFSSSVATGNELDNLIVGNQDANSLNGSGGNDTLEGGGGADVLNGGTGSDTSTYLNASASASWVRNLDGSWTVNAGADGVDMVTNVEFLGFTDRDVFLDRAARTFSGDGASDILWRNGAGQTVVWSVNSEVVTNGAATSLQAGLQWSVFGTGDFGGEGRDDVLWRNTNGQTVIWQMNGAAAQGSATSVQVGAAWSIEGIGDFNLDGRDDILWRNTNGLTVIWQMDGSTVEQAGATSAQVGNVWQIEGIGDFNGDGKDDFLWRHDNGATAIWHMNGTSVASSGVTSLSAGLNWDIAGVGDFDGDGRDDILWRSASGQTAIWRMDGTTVQSALTSVQVGNEWNIAGVGDYNADGKDDILWRHDNGLIVLWDMQGANVVDADLMSIQVGNDWGIV
jgi:Ca2+-binding RTX toxin-like protein